MTSRVLLCLVVRSVGKEAGLVGVAEATERMDDENRSFGGGGRQDQAHNKFANHSHRNYC